MNKNKSDVPIIKLFKHNDEYYLYDTFTNSLFSITEEHYLELCKLKKIGIKNYRALCLNTNVYKDIIQLLNKGNLKSNFIEKVKHPETNNLNNLLDRCINDLVLQVTRDCNFRCRYCLYAGISDVERHHESIHMSWDIAKKSIDFLYDHAKDVEKLNISFYGGEPLLNFDLIRKSVKYANERFFTKSIQYKMTINGSLITDQIIDFIIKNSFDVSISLDGPKEIQNFHRKFIYNGHDTFDIVMRNVNKIKKQNLEYFNKHISFLPVFMHDEDFELVQAFFDSIGVNRDMITPLEANLSGMDYIHGELSLKKFNKTKYGVIRSFIDVKEASFIQQLSSKNPLPRVWHHNGQCIPGVQRVFVDTFGTFFPCEKITEDKTFSIGDISSGFNTENILNFLNIGKLTESECKQCWAMRFCNMCISSCNDLDANEISRFQKLNSCEQQKKNILIELKHYLDINSN